MNIEEALAVVDDLVQPQRLTALQDTIFRECWEGKTYQQIAENSDYDADYIRVVGSRLWQSLTEACNEKVTKNNFRSILRQRLRQTAVTNISLELPNGPLAPNSNFYIERPPIEDICSQEVNRLGALLRIKAPKNMGKKSLLRRILADQSQYYTAILNLQQADLDIIDNFDKLLRWFFANLCSMLELENTIDEYWDEDLGIKVSCTAYFQSYILEQLDRPLVLAIDKLHLIFEHTRVAQEFLPLLRFWHEEANNIPVWQNLRLVVIQCTESHVPLNFNQSPFNVGLPVTLTEFNREQMMELAQKYQIDWQNDSGQQNLTTLMSLIGGHPHLARLAFYNLAQYALTLSQLVEEAATETGIYSNILRYYLVMFYDNPELAKAFKQVISAQAPIQLESIMAYRLESWGLIKLQGNEAIPSCQLYALYFQDRLD